MKIKNWAIEASFEVKEKEIATGVVEKTPGEHVIVRCGRCGVLVSYNRREEVMEDACPQCDWDGEGRGRDPDPEVPKYEKGLSQGDWGYMIDPYPGHDSMRFFHQAFGDRVIPRVLRVLTVAEGEDEPLVVFDAADFPRVGIKDILRVSRGRLHRTADAAVAHAQRQMDLLIENANIFKENCSKALEGTRPQANPQDEKEPCQRCGG